MYSDTHWRTLLKALRLPFGNGSVSSTATENDARVASSSEEARQGVEPAAAAAKRHPDEQVPRKNPAHGMPKVARAVIAANRLQNMASNGQDEGAKGVSGRSGGGKIRRNRFFRGLWGKTMRQIQRRVPK